MFIVVFGFRVVCSWSPLLSARASVAGVATVAARVCACPHRDLRLATDGVKRKADGQGRGRRAPGEAAAASTAMAAAGPAPPAAAAVKGSGAGAAGAGAGGVGTGAGGMSDPGHLAAGPADGMSDLHITVSPVFAVFAITFTLMYY